MASTILTLRDVADLLTLSEKSIYRRAQRGEIPAFKVGGTWRFRRGDIDSWIAAQLPVRKPRKAAK